MSVNKAAIFSDETAQFVQPFDPVPGQAVRFTLRVARGDDVAATLHIVPDSARRKRKKSAGAAYNMQLSHSCEIFDYYTVLQQVLSAPLRYYYEIRAKNETLFFNKLGVSDTLQAHYHFRIVPGFHVPEWARGAVMYQIFPDRFHNGDETNDPVPHEYSYLGKTTRKMRWDEDVAHDDYLNNFYGGDIAGIMQKLPYLQGLGVEVIYLNPIFVSPSSHKYDAQDYDHVDPHLGRIVVDGGEALRFERVDNALATKYKLRTTHEENLSASDALFAEFIAAAHNHGIKVILDGVFNHCGSFNKWLDVAGFYNEKDGAFWSEDSPYHNFFLWHEGGTWPKNTHYDGWWANSNAPKLNYEDSEELFDYIIQIGKKWVSPPYNADGWRLDVAADLGRSPAMNHHFWRAFHDAVKQANPNAIILAEHYGDPTPWLSGREWDTVMNYDAFMEPISWFLTGVSKHSEESIQSLKNDAGVFEGAMRHHMSLLNVHALQSAMNQLSNHDHSRFLTRTNGHTGRLHTVGARAAEAGVDKNIMMEAMVFQFTWTGAPTIYYGDEAGVMGWTDPDNRRPFPWGRECTLLTGLHRALAALRRECPVLRTGSCDFLLLQGGIIVFARWDNTARVIVALNNNHRPTDVILPVWRAGLLGGYLQERLATGDSSFRENSKRYHVSKGEVRLTLPPVSAVVLK
jgi:alpha-glucosidase